MATEHPKVSRATHEASGTTDRQHFATRLGDVSITKLLAICALLLSIAIVSGTIVVGFALVRGSDQGKRINNLGTRVVEQQQVIDHLTTRIDELDGKR